MLNCVEVLSNIAKEYGLFVAAVVYILWFFDKLLKERRADNAEREARYIAVIDKLSEAFQGLKKEVEMIRHQIDRDRKGA